MGFRQYEMERLQLESLCDRVLRVADQVYSERSEFEKVVHSESPDGGTSPVQDLMREAKNRLRSATVEVGVFGSIKRGKSTLINALVGSDISPMRVTPETAIPVWIENGPTRTSVILADGTVVDDLDPEVAREMCTQRYKPKDQAKRPLRVMHQLPIDWLPTGVRIVDTPGLDDPSLAEDYERLTLAELDRVAAAVVVLVSPPGPGGDEIRLLRTLGSRSVDKLFLVCNFYPDHWSDSTVREEMTRYIESVVTSGAGHGLDATDVRVFAVSARSGFRAAVADDLDGLRESGVEALRVELAEYLARGVLQRMNGYVKRRVDMSRALLGELLVQRRRILAQPELAEPIRAALEDEVTRSLRMIDDIRMELARTASELGSDLRATLNRPFDVALSALESAEKVEQAEELIRRLQIQYESAVSEASTLFATTTELAYAQAQKKLYDSLGIAERISTDRKNLGADLGDVAIGASVTEARADWSEVTAGGLVAGTGVGLLAGSLAGGVGLALVAAGPVGWLIGLGLGALLGGGMGAAFTRHAQRGRIGAEERNRVSQDLDRSRSQVRIKVDRTVDEWLRAATDSLEALRSKYFAARQAELARITRIIDDRDARARETRRVDEMLEELKGLEVGR